MGERRALRAREPPSAPGGGCLRRHGGKPPCPPFAPLRGRALRARTQVLKAGGKENAFISPITPPPPSLREGGAPGASTQTCNAQDGYQPIASKKDHHPQSHVLSPALPILAPGASPALRAPSARGVDARALHGPCPAINRSLFWRFWLCFPHMISKLLLQHISGPKPRLCGFIAPLKVICVLLFGSRRRGDKSAAPCPSRTAKFASANFEPCQAREIAWGPFGGPFFFGSLSPRNERALDPDQKRYTQHHGPPCPAALRTQNRAPIGSGL